MNAIYRRSTKSLLLSSAVALTLPASMLSAANFEAPGAKIAAIPTVAVPAALTPSVALPAIGVTGVQLPGAALAAPIPAALPAAIPQAALPAAAAASAPRPGTPAAAAASLDKLGKSLAPQIEAAAKPGASDPRSTGDKIQELLEGSKSAATSEASAPREEATRAGIVSRGGLAPASASRPATPSRVAAPAPQTHEAAGRAAGDWIGGIATVALAFAGMLALPHADPMSQVPWAMIGVSLFPFAGLALIMGASSIFARRGKAKDQRLARGKGA